MDTVKCDEAGLAAAAAVLNRGGVAVIPTDTVYGLAARPDFPEAVGPAMQIILFIVPASFIKSV